MDKIFERAGCMLAALALSTLALAGTASAQGEVTVGGSVEVIGGTSDHADGHDGFDRGLFSRINVGYTNTLDNGLVISGNIAYLLNQRGTDRNLQIDVEEVSEMMSETDPMMDMMVDVDGQGDRLNYAPDVLSISVGGGFGTVSMGHHAMASCAMMPRVIAFVPGGVNTTWYRHFSGLWGSLSNVTWSEANYCGTPTGISYSTPSMGGLSAMVSYAPNTDADQTRSLVEADGGEDYIAIAGSFSSDMGGMNLNVGASFQTAADNYLESAAVAATVGLGGATVGMSWYDNGDRTNGAYRSGTSGWNVGAKYSLGAITPGITYSSMELEASGADAAVDETALAIGASYAVGGGFSAFVEYMAIEVQEAGMAADDETILMSGVTLGF